MSSVQSRVRPPSGVSLPGGPSCPTEILLDIASRLPLHDLRTFVLGSSRLHDVGAYYLYHHIRIDEDCACDMLPALLLRTRPQARTHRRTSPLVYIRTMTFRAIDENDCIRVIPLLGDVLARASNISYLHLDIPPDACSFLISVFMRRGIVRKALSAVWAAFEMSDSSFPRSLFALPRLAGLQITHRRLLPELARYRSIWAIDIREDPPRGGIVEVLEHAAMMELGCALEAFTCGGSLDDINNIVRCVASTLPHLVYFGIHLPHNIFHTYLDTQNVVTVGCMLLLTFYFG